MRPLTVDRLMEYYHFFAQQSESYFHTDVWHTYLWKRKRIYRHIADSCTSYTHPEIQQLRKWIQEGLFEAFVFYRTFKNRKYAGDEQIADIFYHEEEDDGMRAGY
jgi:hypothetical protein